MEDITFKLFLTFLHHIYWASGSYKLFIIIMNIDIIEEVLRQQIEEPLPQVEVISNFFKYNTSVSIIMFACVWFCMLWLLQFAP